MATGHATAWRNVAKVVKSQGLKGEVVVVPIHDLPFVLQEGMDVVLTPPALRGPRARRIVAIRELGSGWGVRLSGITTLDEATKVAGKLVLVRRDDIDEELLEGEYADVIGLAMHDAAYGDIGRIVDVLETLAHDIWVVDGPYGEVLVPAVDEFVTRYPEEGEDTILVDLPNGLVELNAPASGTEEAEES